MTGAFILSLVAAFVGKILGLQTAMGSGLGGQTGAYVLDWSANLMGSISSVLLIALLSIGWLFFNSRRFAAWFNGLGTGEPRPRKAREEEPESEAEEDEEEIVEEDEPEQEPVAAPKPSIFSHTRWHQDLKLLIRLPLGLQLLNLNIPFLSLQFSSL